MNDTEPPHRPPGTRGRKRDPGRTDAILRAAVDLLLEVGYDRFRIQDVAKRAGAGTGAIYRRWSSKQALVADAIATMTFEGPPTTDDAWADLRAVVHAEFAGHAGHPDRVPGLVSAMRADERIATAVRDGYTLQSYRTRLARILGDAHPHLDVLSEFVPGTALLRASFAPETLDADAMTDAFLALIASLAEAPGAD